MSTEWLAPATSTMWLLARLPYQRSNSGLMVRALDVSSLAGVGFRHGDGFEPGFPCCQHGRQRAANRTNTTIERQFSKEHALIELFLPKKCPRHPTSPRGHGQIASGAFFANIGGCEIYGYALDMRKFVTAVAHRGLDTFAVFLTALSGRPTTLKFLK
jgi:hypothetical protein